MGAGVIGEGKLNTRWKLKEGGSFEEIYIYIYFRTWLIIITISC